ncbi:MAG TPA: hypothetical protein DCY84_00535, partial [Firmicutes bacterium]|nr:hypothetical protein [Bacillota bacterium]
DDLIQGEDLLNIERTLGYVMLAALPAFHCSIKFSTTALISSGLGVQAVRKTSATVEPDHCHNNPTLFFIGWQVLYACIIFEWYAVKLNAEIIGRFVFSLRRRQRQRRRIYLGRGNS